MAAVGDADGYEIAAILAELDQASVAAAVRALDEETARQIRWLFTSFGTCSTDEPVADLVSLGDLPFDDVVDGLDDGGVERVSGHVVELLSPIGAQHKGGKS